MPKSDAEEVDSYMDALDHPMKPEIETLCEAISSADPGISERIKWNAPSFCYQGQDRITLKLHPVDRIQIIFHRGPKRVESMDVAITDPRGLLQWRSSDRAVLTFLTPDEVADRVEDVARISRDWIHATV